MRHIVLLCTIISTLAFAGVGAAQPDPNLAMNNPDQQAWELFLMVNADAATAGNNNAVFETWARDDQTFQPNPVWPTTPTPGPKNGPPALSMVAQLHRGLRIQVVPGGNNLIGEETRRNRPDFDFIVANSLYKVSGLRAAYAAGKPISFPVDSIEVKANWVDVTRLKEYNGFAGSLADASKLYHVNTASDGKIYALVAFHIISKLVPNWTWATWEHKDNPGRCDVIGCKDSFGAQDTWIPPLSPTETTGLNDFSIGKHYPDCKKSAELQALLTSAHIDPAFSNYCLKGSQADFTDPSGLALRLGNSVTEHTFVAQASCISCHGRAAIDSSGHQTSFAGFDILPPIADPHKDPDKVQTGAAPVGPISAAWYWWDPKGPPSSPALSDKAGVLTRFALPVDFVWSVAFCAIDDTATPPETQSFFCHNK